METVEAPPPPTTTAPQPVPFSIPGNSTDPVFVDAQIPTMFFQHEAAPGVVSREAESAIRGHIRPALEAGWDAEGAALKPARNPTSPGACSACVAVELGRQRQRHPENTVGGSMADSRVSSLLQAGEGGGGADDAAGGAANAHHQRHTCGRGIGTGSAFSLSSPSAGGAGGAGGGSGAATIMSSQKQLGTARVEQHDDGAVVTPVTVTGVGASLGAEHDITPLMSRTPREGAGEGAERSNRLEESGSNSDKGEGNLKRKDTITWEAFLQQNLTIRDGEDGAASNSNSNSSASDSSSPVDSRLYPAAGTARLSRKASGSDSSVRSRYLRVMSNARAIPWNTGGGDGDNDDDDGEEGESVELPGVSEDQAVAAPSNMPRILNGPLDSEVVKNGLMSVPRPPHLDIGRSRSLSSMGLLPVNDVRKSWQAGINKFNVNPKEGINFLAVEGLLTDTAEGICDFLSTAEGLSKRRLGEYFGRDNPKTQEVLGLFLKRLNFKDKTLDESLRSTVLRFRLPGEAQQMDRIMEAFSRRYHEENPGVFSCSETAWVLSFALMMLNTDMYNRNIRESDKMTESQFVKNHRGIDQGKDPDHELLKGMYRRIKESEIRMDEGDMYESEVITFVAPKKSGWLKKKSKGYVGKWKRHWFVLNDAVLYYFIAPQHQDEAPRCIIPLERIYIDPIGNTDLSLSLRGTQGVVKSVKMNDNGIMEQGHHRSFVLRADTRAERDAWVERLRAEVPTLHMDVTPNRSTSATPVTSSAATPVGTPSESGRRSSRFGSRATERKRRATLALDSSLPGTSMPPPVIRGWARTHNDKQQIWGRRYIALFRGVGHEMHDVIYFFGDSFMCDKMVNQSVRTHHGFLLLSDVLRVQLRQEDGSRGGRAIALRTGAGKEAKEMVILPEEQREFLSWTRHIKECCPDSSYSIAADGTPISGKIDETAFPSVNTADSFGEAMPTPFSSIGRNIHGDHMGIQGNVFVLPEAPSTTESINGSKGVDSSDACYGRAESSETQDATGTSNEHGMDRVLAMPNAATEPDTNDDTRSPGIHVPRKTSSHEVASPSTDVE